MINMPMNPSMAATLMLLWSKHQVGTVSAAGPITTTTMKTTTLNLPNDKGSNNNNNDGGGVLQFELLPAKRVLQRRLEEHEQRRRLDPELPPLQVDALYQGYGTHYCDLWVGTPTPQRQTVIVDTGSSVTAFPCQGCNDCGNQYHTDDYYDPEHSDTFRKLGCSECHGGTCRKSASDADGYCSLRMSYAEGSSWSAYEAEDYLYAGGSHAAGVNVDVEGMENGSMTVGNEIEETIVKFETKFVFGCQSSLTGLFRTQLADGIMGMSNERNTFWEQMYRNNKITQKQFSLCFSRQDLVDPDGTGAGAMSVGGFDTRLHKSPVVYANEVSSSRSFFTVYVQSIYLREGGGDSLVPDNMDQVVHKIDVSENDLNSRGVIVDSGTTDTYFTSKLARPFKAKFKEITGRDYGNDAMEGLTLDDVKRLPTLILQLRGLNSDEAYPSGTNTVGLAGPLDEEHPLDVLVAVPATHYMEYDSDSQSYTPRIYLSESSGSVLGANAMQGHDVIFDLELNRIGFAESDCNYHPPDLTAGAVEQKEEAEGSKKIEQQPIGGGGGEDGAFEDEEDTTYMQQSSSSSGSVGQMGEETIGDDEGDSSSSSGQSFFAGVLSGGMCSTSSSTCQAVLGAGALMAVVAVFAGFRYARNRSRSRGIRMDRTEVQAIPVSDHYFDDENDMVFDNDEEEILSPTSNPVV